MSDCDLTAKKALVVTEEELQRIVLDMHDGPVQHLFAALRHRPSIIHVRYPTWPTFKRSFRQACISSR
jgi:signal transduction histidine kinase